MIDLTKPVQTKDGRAVRILCVDAARPKCIVGLVDKATPVRGGHQDLVSWFRSGNYVSNVPSEWDLMNVPTETIEYVTVRVKLTRVDGVVVKREVQE